MCTGSFPFATYLCLIMRETSHRNHGCHYTQREGLRGCDTRLGFLEAILEFYPPH